MTGLSRRDFLKLGSVLSGVLAASRLLPQFFAAQFHSTSSLPNILIFVFDAMSASNLSLYGYRRRTTPNLERFAQRATVYHAHYSAATFTTPGTASLLTGLYPWTHRAIDESGLIARHLAEQNIFRALGRSYYRLAFSQNIWPNYFFGQFQRDIEKILSPASFGLLDQVISQKFGADLVDSHRAFDDFLFQDGKPPASLVFGLAENLQLYGAVDHNTPAEDYPDGLPCTENYPIYFKLKDVFDGLIATVQKLTPPSLAYLHTWSPHGAYRPTRDFGKLFLDDWAPDPKPVHRLAGGNPLSTLHTNAQRQEYDRYIANLDAEFGRLLDALGAQGILDHSYVVVTSDHGELLERGVEGHLSPLLYEPVVRVPLLISSPGQTSRRDVNVPTSSIDVLPTLVHISGGEVPAWCEGQVLPALGGLEDPQRSIFMMDAKKNAAFSALSNASIALRKGRYKLIDYIGYRQYGTRDKFELYDIESDPEELNNIYSKTSPVAAALRTELLARLESVNSKFTRAG